MLAKTRAIVLHTLKYGDNSVILKCYTESDGLKSFIAGGLHSKSGAIKPSLVQPMSQLEVVYYEKGKSELKRLKEASVAHAYDQLFYDPIKSSLALFLAEFLSRVVREEEPNQGLFDFLENSLRQLDVMGKGFGRFHLVFMFKLPRYLGFTPEKPEAPGRYFDLINGVYTDREPPHRHYLNAQEAQVWRDMHRHASEGSDFPLNAAKRDFLLHSLLEYYRLHIHDFGELRSLAVLRELLH